LLNAELLEICNKVWLERGLISGPVTVNILISAQGGIGTSNENKLFLDYYEIDSTGWGSPFLLVPEATNVDEKTLDQLTKASKSDYFLSYASPLGVPFNNFRPSTSEAQRKNRIAKGRPGSPCYKKFLSSDTEFTERPICVASREYQHLKIKQLEEKQAEPSVFEREFNKITEKDCLCEGLGTPVLLKNNLTLSHKLQAVTICPGPNLAYFSKISTLRDMVDHIYGRSNILNSLKRPNIFVNELMLYTDYLKNEIKNSTILNISQTRYFQKFKANLLNGIEYYRTQLPLIRYEQEKNIKEMFQHLFEIKQSLERIIIPEVEPVS
jgi:hypothetical protein